MSYPIEKNPKLVEKGKDLPSIDRLPKFVLLEIFKYLLEVNKKEFLNSISFVNKRWSQLAYHPILWQKESKLLDMPEEEVKDKNFKDLFLERIQKICNTIDFYLRVDFTSYSIQKKPEEWLFIFRSQQTLLHRENTKRRKVVESEVLNKIDLLVELEHLLTTLEPFQALGIIKSIDETKNKVKKNAYDLFYGVFKAVDPIHEEINVVLTATDHPGEKLNYPHGCLWKSEHSITDIKIKLFQFAFKLGMAKKL